MRSRRNHDAQAPLTSSVFHVLLALADGDKHGYAIMQSIEAITEGRVRMGPGTLYGIIKRLLECGWIVQADERPDPALDDERRKYYRLTGTGRSALQAEAGRYRDLVRAAEFKGMLPARSHLL